MRNHYDLTVGVPEWKLRELGVQVAERALRYQRQTAAQNKADVRRVRKAEKLRQNVERGGIKAVV